MNTQHDNRDLEVAPAGDGERLRLFFDAALESIVVHADGVILEANASAGLMFGCAPEEMIGLGVLQFVAPGSRELVSDRIAEWVEGACAAAGLRKDGSSFPAEVQTKNVVYRGRPARVTVLRDVSERQAAESALRGRERQLRATFDGALDGMSILDDAGQFLDLNPAACELFGLPRDQLLYRKIADFASPRADFEQAWSGLCDKQQERGEFRLSRPDGATRHIEFTATADVLPSRHLLMLRDVSERKRLEQQLRQALKMEALGRLAGGVAHDFNNLLTAITSYSELLLEALAEVEAPRRYAEEILRAADRAAALTRQLLAYSRQQVLAPQVLNLNTVVAGLERLLRRLIGEDVMLETTLAQALRRVKIDPGQIEQVLMNLAVNARDAMPQGGMLTISTANVELDEAYAWNHADVQPGAYVRLSVADTGTGMAEEVRARVFEPFFTTKDVGKGTGLGLSTVYGIIKQSEGHIDVESAPAQGTTFHVYLPQVIEPARPTMHAVPRAQVLHGTETVLLVEDDDVVRALMRTVLERHGYTVIEASHGPEALAMIGSFAGPLHLLLTDVVMPHMNGRQLYLQVARQRPGLKVLYMSGYTGGAIAHLGELEAEAAFLQKPFPADTLARKVREVLEAGGKE